MAESNVRGLAELNQILEQLPTKLRANVIRGGLRAGMVPVKRVAAGNIHNFSGELARGLRIGTRVRGNTVSANLTAKGKHGFVARWVEFGTAAHSITAKFRKGLSFGGAFFQSVDHPGARPKPFLRPALDSQATAAVVAVGQYIKERLSKKEGINTAHINIEGDE